MEHMLEAGIKRVYWIIDSRKLDIPACFGDGTNLGLDLSYLTIIDSPATPATLDVAYSNVASNICALGFPDILFQPCGAYQKVLNRLRATTADVVLGLFPTNQPEMVDMVSHDQAGHVLEIAIKPKGPTQLVHTWSIAVWKPQFTQFMHDFVKTELTSRTSQGVLSEYDAPRELFVGDVIQAGLKHGLRIMCEIVSETPSLDAGTHESLALARQSFGSQQKP
jgi:glucose-1-phosphate thymidylyltransferase